MKSGTVIINSIEEFSVAANKFLPSIATLFLKEKDFLCGPDDITLYSSNLTITYICSVKFSRGWYNYWFLFPLKLKRTLPYSVIFGKEMWSLGEGVWIFSTVSLTLRLLYEKVLRGEWDWRLVRISNVSPVVSWKVLQTVAIIWFNGQ